MIPAATLRSSTRACYPAALLLLPLLAVAACGGSGPTDTGGNGNGGEPAPSVESVEVTPSSGEIDAVDKTIEFSAVARDADGDPVDGTTFDWTSTDEATATVDDAGVATAVANGQTTVRATAEGVTGEADLTVEQVPVQVTVAPADDTLTSEGETRQFDASSADANGHPVQDASYAWSSSVESVATVDASGLATAEGEGETEITATSDPGGVEGSQLLVVDLPDGPQGDPAGLRDVVINEVNWFGNGADAADEWIELRNVSGAELNLSGWTLEAAGTGADPVTLSDGTVLAAGAYLVIAAKQGADQDGERTSLTGVAGVQIQPVALTNAGEELVLRDVEGTLVDATPTGAWPAGDDATLESMERRDDVTGGGYGAGGDASAWYTWNAADGTDTTSPATADSGTPGADNTDPDATAAGTSAG